MGLQVQREERARKTQCRQSVLALVHHQVRCICRRMGLYSHFCQYCSVRAAHAASRPALTIVAGQRYQSRLYCVSRGWEYISDVQRTFHHGRYTQMDKHTAVSHARGMVELGEIDAYSVSPVTE
jgi:hypothetical protein